MPAIERSAGEAFRAVEGLAWVADDGVTSAADHQRYIDAGWHWVAALDAEPLGEAGALAGFVACTLEGDSLHIDEMSVARAFQQRGIGQALMAAAEGQARARGLVALTLTTFDQVAFNAPFYARLGFERLAEEALDLRLAAILAAEARRGLEGRCAMRKRLG